MQTAGKLFVSTHEDGRSGNDQYPRLDPGQCPMYEDRLLVLCRFLSVTASGFVRYAHLPLQRVNMYKT